MHLVVPIAAIAVIAAYPALAQVSGTDTTRSREDRAYFPDPTLPQANTSIPQVRQKVTTPLSELVDEENSEESASPEEVAAFLGLEPAAETAPESSAEEADQLDENGAGETN